MSLRNSHEDGEMGQINLNSPISYSNQAKVHFEGRVTRNNPHLPILSLCDRATAGLSSQANHLHTQMDDLTETKCLKATIVCLRLTTEELCECAPCAARRVTRPPGLERGTFLRGTKEAHLRTIIVAGLSRFVGRAFIHRRTAGLEVPERARALEVWLSRLRLAGFGLVCLRLKLLLSWARLLQTDRWMKTEAALLDSTRQSNECSPSRYSHELTDTST